MKGLPSSQCKPCNHYFFLWSCMDDFFIFLQSIPNPIGSYHKFLTCIAFQLIMCRPTMWSHMHKPFLAIFQNALNFPSNVHAWALVGAGCWISWESNKSSLESEGSLFDSDLFTWVCSAICTNQPWLIKLWENKTKTFNKITQRERTLQIKEKYVLY